MNVALPRRSPPLALRAVLSGRVLPVVGAAILSLACAIAQEEPGLDKAGVEARQTAMQADPALDEALKKTLDSTYGQALEDLAAAEKSRRGAGEFRAAVLAAPAETAKLQAELDALPDEETAAKAALPEAAELAKLRTNLNEQRARVAELDSSKKSCEAEWTRIKERPAEIAARIPAARSELTGIEAKLSALPGGDSGAKSLAERTALEARREAVNAELEMLRQERLSQQVREERLAVQKDLLGRQLGNGGAALAAIEGTLSEALLTDAERAVQRVNELAEAAGDGDPAVLDLVTELRELTSELQAAAEQLKQIREEHALLRGGLEDLTEDQRRILEAVELGAMEGTFSEVLFEQRRRLPNPRTIAHFREQQADSLRRARLSSFRVGDKLRQQPAVDNRFAEQGDPAVTELVGARREILEKLSESYAAQSRELGLIMADQQSYHDKTTDIYQFLTDELFWRRSSPPFSWSSIVRTSDGARWLIRAERWHESLSALGAIPRRRPGLSILAALAAALLLLARKRIIGGIGRTGQKIRRISQDRYLHTAKAVGLTLLLALPVPLLVSFVAWSIRREAQASDWLRGVGIGLRYCGWILAALWFLASSCRPGGLGPAHLGWDARAAGMLRRGLIQLFAFYLPALLLICSTIYEETAQHFDSLGRLVFCLSHLWMSFVTWRLLRPSDGIPVGRPDSRFRPVVAGVLSVFPVLLAAVAAIGYFTTSLVLSLVYLASVGLVAAGLLLYGLVLRWFLIRERRFALEEALRDRQARQQEEKEEEAVAAPDEVIPTAEEDLELDLASVGEKTRHLLGSLTWVGVVVAILALWTRSLPIDEALGNATIGGWLNLLALAKAALLLFVFTTLVRDLPGLLDLGGLRGAAKDPGTRVAITTICQYAVGAVGLALLAQALELDWAQFGWIAAALSVGLGFGLQEIVANFVCGIILLFERPIRVGDIVTVDNVDGTVTRIRMRATTITNWDRKEFVVPNKNFITGTLMNWTLSSQVNRIVILVGVAYGSDTDKACRLLLEAANDHPLVLDEPAPRASFEQFADSSLNLVLRCFLPDMDNRVKTIGELHTDIDRRFREAGIEIPFPQQDIHLRSVDRLAGETLRAGRGDDPDR